MSRIGKLPVVLENGVKAAVEASTVKIEGAKGKLQLAVPQGIKVEQKNNELVVTRLGETKQHRANHGTVRSHLKNMVKGVSKGFKKDIELTGLGYRAELKGKKIVFNLGLSHPVEFPVPDDVKVAVPNQNAISIEGIDITRVGQVAAKIRGLKPAEPYKGKGFKYAGEVIRRKQGKSVTKK